MVHLVVLLYKKIEINNIWYFKTPYSVVRVLIDYRSNITLKGMLFVILHESFSETEIGVR